VSLAKARGIVIGETDQHVWIQTTKNASCDSCTAKGTCASHGDKKEFKIEAVNYAGAKRGDNVEIGFRTASLFKISFLLYIIPILFLIIGALTGEQIALSSGRNPSTLAAIFGFSMLFVSWLVIKSVGNKISNKSQYKPEVIRILKETEPLECNTGTP